MPYLYLANKLLVQNSVELVMNLHLRIYVSF